MNSDILLPTLSFPLNVYAQSLLIELGTVDYLHYGLWESTEEPLKVAQQRASDKLWSVLPKLKNSGDKQKLLEVGIGLGTSARYLLDRGFDYIGVTPDNNQILYAWQRYQRDLVFKHTPFEKFQSPSQFDLIIFQESAQYIQTNLLLQGCQQLLKAQGEVIIMDEIPANLAQNLHKHIENAGFDVKQIEDLTALAAPSISYLYQVISKHQQTICEDLNISVQKLTGLLTTLHRREQAYLNGDYTYKLINFSKP